MCYGFQNTRESQNVRDHLNRLADLCLYISPIYYPIINHKRNKEVLRTDMNEPDANRAKTMDNFKVREPRAPMVWWFIHGSSTAIIGYMYIDKLIDNVIYQSAMNVQATNKY
jgi:hypothetical protein